jgi:hypothetical protein
MIYLVNELNQKDLKSNFTYLLHIWKEFQMCRNTENKRDLRDKKSLKKLLTELE